MFYIVFCAQVVVVMGCSTLNAVRYQRELKNFYSNLKEKSIEINRAVLIGLYVLLATYIIAAIVWSASHNYRYYVGNLLFIATGVCVYYMSYHVCQIRFTARSLFPEEGC